MISEKINEALRYFKNGIFLLNEILAECDAENDIASLRRSRFRFVEDDPNVLSFPGKQKSPLLIVEEADFLENPDGGEPSEGSEQGFVEFTEKEIMTMPKNLRQLIIVNRKRCRMRRRPCGNGYTYEIRFRAQGYNLSASGKTKALAKANMLEKLKKAKPQKKEDPSAVPTTFNAFAIYHFEKFRKPKVAEETYEKDMQRYQKYLVPSFKETPLKKITPTHCIDLLDSVKKQGKGKTADELHSLMNGIFKSAISHALIERNPLDTVFHVQHDREEGEALTLEAEETLIRRLPFMECGLELALVLFCGLRANELENKKHPPEIHGEFIKAVNSKRKFKDKSKIEFKYIPICDRLRPFLKNGIEIKYNARSTYRRLKKILPNNTLKDLRTTFYTRCQTFGIAEPALKEFMGHSFGKLGNAYSDLTKHKEYLLSEGKKLNKW